MALQSNEDLSNISQVRIQPDEELDSDVRRSLAKIFNKLLVKEPVQSKKTESPPSGSEQSKND